MKPTENHYRKLVKQVFKEYLSVQKFMNGLVHLKLLEKTKYDLKVSILTLIICEINKKKTIRETFKLVKQVFVDDFPCKKIMIG